MSNSIPIIIEEIAGINRYNEPVIVGIPFPRGLLKDVSSLRLHDSKHGHLPLQTQTLARWSDGTSKWVLLDFQVSVEANTTKELELIILSSHFTEDDQGGGETEIKINSDQNYFNINTNAASFFIDTNVFKPFDRILIEKNDILDKSGSRIILTDKSGIEYEPRINNIFIETEGKLRTTLKVEGEFESFNKLSFANFFSRLSFFADSSKVKIEFTIINPRAAKHPGGLWDLGDQGSILFSDLSMYTISKTQELPAINYQLNDEPSAMNYELNSTSNLIIYQDSSGGRNWKSLNHVNRNGEVKNSFKGYRVFSDGDMVEEGFRANPIMSINDKDKQISVSIRDFWQNFPKSLEVKGNTLITRLFPNHYNDIFELQGGEQKTHTIFLNFDVDVRNKTGLEWIQNPLIPRTTPEWYSKSKALYYLISQDEDTNNEYIDLINPAIKGENTFFNRREIIDEYGWRNFGELYADHEAVGHKGDEPLISHYNNQYDGIYGTLIQYLKNGDRMWFVLADQLCSHVKDIDIYHTDDDRPEYNEGLFWHTNHYIDAQTSTHRCFSKKHVVDRNMAAYGGGPSLSHNYTSGFLLHYYLTGSYSSLETVKELASFVENNMYCEHTLTNNTLKILKKTISFAKDILRKQPLMQNNKVYGLDGPGRASGNSLNTLLDAHILTDKKNYLVEAEYLIRCCIHPDDNIGKRDLLDVENRWMYVVFLQSLGKYLDVKAEHSQLDDMWHYAKQSLINYAEWMVQNEHPYLERTEKLEFPNETWAAQEIRKCNVLLYAAKYTNSNNRDRFFKKASYFYNEGMNYLVKFETKTLTRPIVLMMLNGMMYNYFKSHKIEDIKFQTFLPISKEANTKSLFVPMCSFR